MTVIRRTLGVLGEVLITAGAFLLLFVVWQLWWTDVVADAEQSRLSGVLQEQWQAQGRGPDSSVSDPSASEPSVSDPSVSDPSVSEARAPGELQGDPPPVALAEAGKAFALVHVPRFGTGYEPRIVLEGTDEETLQDGVGHYTGTALPGAVGNFALAGHRVTYGKPFNAVADLREGDAVMVETKDTWFTYRVREYLIVTPAQLEVIAPSPGSPGAVPTERLLTLTTCNPMFSARERYIVHATLESWQPVTQGEPTSLTLAEG